MNLECSVLVGRNMKLLREKPLDLIGLMRNLSLEFLLRFSSADSSSNLVGLVKNWLIDLEGLVKNWFIDLVGLMRKLFNALVGLMRKLLKDRVGLMRKLL